MNKTISMRIIGHELVTVKEREEVTGDDGVRRIETVECDMLKVKLRGLDEDKKTVCTMLMEPECAHDFPLGDNGELQFEIRQQRLDLKEGAS